MRKIIMVSGMAILGCCALQSMSQDDQAMKAMMNYMTPGPIHKMLAQSVGTWNSTVSFWMAPNTQPLSSVIETRYDTLLGGRYLQGRNTGNMMGMPFEGIGVTGYDNAKKVFVSSWIDNMGTGMLFMEGTWDDASKSINFKGTMIDPATGKEMPVREVMQIPDGNHQLITMYQTANGKEYKSMEISAVRK